MPEGAWAGERPPFRNESSPANRAFAPDRDAPGPLAREGTGPGHDAARPDRGAVDGTQVHGAEGPLVTGGAGARRPPAREPQAPPAGGRAGRERGGPGASGERGPAIAQAGDVRSQNAPNATHLCCAKSRFVTSLWRPWEAKTEGNQQMRVTKPRGGSCQHRATRGRPP